MSMSLGSCSATCRITGDANLIDSSAESSVSGSSHDLLSHLEKLWSLEKHLAQT